MGKQMIFCLGIWLVWCICGGKVFADEAISKDNKDAQPIAVRNAILEQCRFKEEPTINQVQARAIAYAEVQPEKIMQWRKLAAKKAWLPQLHMGFNRDTSDLWHWESGSTTRECDDQLQKGKASIDWDISLTWDLADLIWSTDQTAIDTRSRLMVQLRDDVLDEVTRVYFERLKTRLELETVTIAEVKKRKEKELRIAELTGYLDGLTGGYFSRQGKPGKD